MFVLFRDDVCVYFCGKDLYTHISLSPQSSLITPTSAGRVCAFVRDGV